MHPGKGQKKGKNAGRKKRSRTGKGETIRGNITEGAKKMSGSVLSRRTRLKGFEKEGAGNVGLALEKTQRIIK